MGTFFAQYPASSGGSANASVGPNGQPIPTSSTLVAGENPSGDQQPLQTDASGNLKVDIASSSGLANPLPVTDAAAEASLANIDTTTQDILTEAQNIDGNTGNIATSSVAIEGYVNSIDAKTPNLGPALSTSSVPVVLATDQVPLPTSNASVGVTGATPPTSATQIGATGIISGNLQTLFVDESSGNALYVTDSAATGFLGTLASGIGGIAPGQQLSVNSVSVVPASNSAAFPVSGTITVSGGATAALQSNVQSTPGTPQTVAITVQGNASGVAVPISAASLPLPALAATSTKQSDGTQKTQVVDGSGNVIGSTANALDVNVKSSTTLATTTNLTQVNGSTISLDQKTMVNSLPVVIASNQSAVPVSGTIAATQSGTWTVQPGNTANTTAWLVVESGLSAVNHVTNAYASVNVTTAAYVQILASTSAAVKEVEIFDSSGQSLVLATGAAASEVDQIYIFPGGNGRIKLAIAASTRVSIKAVSANATTGNIYVNFYG